ncbi:ATP-dependent protease ClpP, protease subunit [Caloramator fervidus]|uniref:ATP-dependent protease ClpP, protease subunit n=1 Tax=Caloramator fervidus TaxID=29344 RepID=A0A1H5S6A4_9CLOT|nr:ATP-dependent Clp protease proteolytic subunit [Caloramator fervidus]SEF46172.1 ATP-dependent protease ClpP, protease subunit [Caloramator fervidus]
MCSKKVKNQALKLNYKEVDEKNEKLENLKEIGNINIPDVTSEIFTITIIGQIEGHTVLPPQTKATKYEHLLPQLVSIEENPNIKGVLVILNTVGGDVEAGLAIAEMINSLSKPTVSLVIGGGHSIGVPLAVATNYSFISPTATMTIHPIRMNGLVIGVPQTFEYFSKMQDRILSFIVRNSKITKERLMEMMLQTDELLNDTGTILIGKQAVEEGLIDEVGGISQAIKKLREMINQRQI